MYRSRAVILCPSRNIGTVPRPEVDLSRASENHFLYIPCPVAYTHHKDSSLRLRAARKMPAHRSPRFLQLAAPLSFGGQNII
jgi:hypothetical protein